MDLSYVTVVGSANMDIGGTPYGSLREADSNPGRITLSVGGVGGNIARNLSLMGVSVRFVTALGGDIFAGSIRAGFEAEGIDLTYSAVDPLGRSSAYLFITDRDGDMRLALSDMEPSMVLTPEFLKTRIDMINGGAALVLDANLAEDSIMYLADSCTVPIFADTVSAAKAPKLKKAMGRLYALKPNRLEAELLTGIKITDGSSMEAAAAELLKTGLKSVYITLGADGVFCMDGENRVLVPAMDFQPVNTTGAGDAFTAGLVKAFLSGSDLEDSGRLGCAGAMAAAISAETVNPDMSEALLNEILKKV